MRASLAGVMAAGLVLIAAPPALAQTMDSFIVDLAPGSVLNLEFTTVDLLLEDLEVEGAPEGLAIAETATEIRIELSADILFDFDSADIRKEAADALMQVAAMIEERPGAPVRIEGHTDSKGSEDYNQRLSENRAQSVMDWFTDFGGLESVSFEIIGLGESDPAAPNENADGSDNPEGRQANRRVEIVIGK